MSKSKKKKKTSSHQASNGNKKSSNSTNKKTTIENKSRSTNRNNSSKTNNKSKPKTPTANQRNHTKAKSTQVSTEQSKLKNKEQDIKKEKVEVKEQPKEKKVAQNKPKNTRPKKARIASISEMEKELDEERKELRQNQKNRKKQRNIKRVKKFFIFNFLLGSVCCFIGLFVVYGPNTKFRDWYITTAEGSMNHHYLARWFYDEPTISFVMSRNNVIESGASTDTSLYNMDSLYEDVPTGKVTYKNEYERQILERDQNHLDYKIIEFKDEKLKSGRVFDGYMAVIYDPSKIHTVTTQYLRSRGEYLKNMAIRVNAQVAINGGGFVDPGLNSNGSTPCGITISHGKTMTDDATWNGSGGIIGFNEQDQLVLTKCSNSQAQYLGIRDCVTFGPFLIVNGEASKVLGNGGWGVAPRSCIGQRADGIVLMFVCDGRKGLKQGIDMNDEIEIMQRYGAINASNLDGGTSSVMIVEGEMVNDPIDSTGAHKTRWIASGWYLEPEGGEAQQ